MEVFLGSIRVRSVIDGAEAGARFSLVEHPMSPHALAAPLHLPTPEDECSFVPEGRIGALLGDDVVEAGSGNLVFEPRDHWHTLWYAGDGPRRILEIISPVGFERFFHYRRGVTASSTTSARPRAGRRVDPLRFFSAEQVARARSYHRPLYVSAAVELTLATAFLAALTWSTAGGALDPLSLPWWARTFTYASIIIALSAALRTPLAFWRGYLRERRFGFSTQTWRGWSFDWLKAVGINLGLVPPLLLGLVGLARALPGWWVVPAAAAFGLVVFVFSFLAPVLLTPLFNRYRPLDQEPLRSELHTLASAAGVSIEEVLIEDTSRRTRKTNAYVTGLGRTRRLVVSDTLLGDASQAEIRTVVAHELGHRRMRHVLAGTVLSVFGAIVNTVVVWALLGAKAADPHRLPLLLLMALALAVITAPALNALSRRWERNADRFALDLTHDPAAYEQAFRRLAATNLTDLDPPELVYLLLFTHPTPPQRLAAAFAR